MSDEKTIDPCLGKLSKSIRDDHDSEGGVFLFREEQLGTIGGDKYHENCTLGELLVKRENQSGMWLVETGQGYPPGHYVVIWNDAEGVWDAAGYYYPGIEADYHKSGKE